MSTNQEMDFSALDRVKDLMKNKCFNEALMLVGELCGNNPYSSYLWNVRARLEMLEGGSDDNPFGKAEKFLLNAYEINPNDMETLEELMHFYDVIEPDREKAQKFKALIFEKIDILKKNLDDDI